MLTKSKILKTNVFLSLLVLFFSLSFSSNGLSRNPFFTNGKIAADISVSAGADKSLILPINSSTLDGSASSFSGSIVSTTWTKISGPTSYLIANTTTLNTTVSNLEEGIYLFSLTVADNLGNTGSDTMAIVVTTRILIDFGGQFTSSPDGNGFHWNNINAGTPGIKLSNAINIQNQVTNIGLEVVNRIDGTFNLAGPGVNTANTIGAIGEYPATATSDYAFSHPSTTTGQWKLTGLDTGTTYRVKFWGTRNGVPDIRFIEIKRSEESTWQSYDARNNSNPDNAAVFIFTGKADQVFDIRTQSGSSFGHICLIDIQKVVNPTTPNLSPIAYAGSDLQLILPGNSSTLDGSSSSDPDGTIVHYQWKKIVGPASYTIVTPNTATTLVTNLSEGVYQFELAVTDNDGATDKDTVTLQVGSRILIDFGDVPVSSPDPNFNYYWNTVTTGTPGLKINNATTTGNVSTQVDMEIVNRIDGTFNLSGPGVNTGSLVGVVGDYTDDATSDYCFSHPSTTEGQWKFSGLDTSKIYSFKFWGSRSVPDPRIIEIKPSYETVWQSYDASNNSNFNNAAFFTITGRNEVIFDIRTGSTSPFGYINIVDINYTNTCNETTSTTDTAACNSYTWNGNTYTASGTYTHLTTNAAGCDSTATLNLTIKQPTYSTTFKSACDSFRWNNITYTTSGTYTWNGTNAAGCDSIATLNLIVNLSINNTYLTVSACNSYTWKGRTYDNSGTYTCNCTTNAGCDSVVTLILTINRSSTSTETESACGSYTWNGNTYTASGTYTWTGTNAAGCDSIVTLNLTINETSSSTETESACGSYTWNGNTYTASGTYTWTGTNAAGCDSTATLNLTINESSSSTETESACGSYTWNGNTYTASGTYTWIGTNAAGCDSTATLNLTINESSSSTETESACGSYTWNGNTYTASGTYTWIGTNAAGCDSTATLNLTINESSSSTETESACGSYTWNGNTYTASGTYTWIGTNAAGCDSTATLNLTINESSSSTETESACGSYTWNGNTYTASGTYTWTGTNAAGCDSTATLNLTINESSSSTETESACGSYTWNGNTYTASGTYTWTGTNAAGCDSIATLNLTINESSSSTETESACGSYTWNGNTYTASGTYTWTGTNAAGCDSTATLNLTINESSSNTETESACGSYTWNGNTYTASGTYTWTGTNAAGCDSIVTLNLTVDALTVSAGADQVIESDANATLNGSITGTSISYIWTGGNGTFNPGNTSLNTVYTPSSDEITNGFVELYLTAISNCGVTTDTIKITITNTTPVTIIDFKGVNTPQGNRLQWNTSMEQNNAGFEIQSSFDGQRFVTIGYVKSLALNGNSQSTLNYQYLDVNLGTGKHYYRLKQLDLDQKSTLSKVISIQVNKSNFAFNTNVFPNPTKDNINLAVISTLNGSVQIEVTDVAGKTIYHLNRYISKGTQNIHWSVANWSNGTYFIRLRDSNGNYQVNKFIKN